MDGVTVECPLHNTNLQFTIYNLQWNEMKFSALGFTTFSLLRFGLHERSLHERGFTLVELLVVVAIMALAGTYTLSNYGSFGEDQKLKNAVLDIQSQLRLAQTNATANVKCNTQYGALWQVEFPNTTTMQLTCAEQPSRLISIKKTLRLSANITILKICKLNDNSCIDGQIRTNVIAFVPLNGEVLLQGWPALEITLKNIKTGSTKSLVIEKGGRIYAQ